MAGTKKSPVALDRTVTHRLHTLYKLTDRISQAAYLADAGLPLSEGRCLSAVGAFAPLSVNDLAQQANLNKGQASRAAQALVDQGLVRKEASATDGRGVVLALTAKGERAWRRVMDVIERRNGEIVGCLDAAERRQLDRLLDRLVEHARVAAQGTSED
ncbi:MAG: MarR family winged helix-turn-helix transcriptional regulator [Caldimonas sp.]